MGGVYIGSIGYRDREKKSMYPVGYYYIYIMSNFVPTAILDCRTNVIHKYTLLTEPKD